jgi:hypothetical protein
MGIIVGLVVAFVVLISSLFASPEGIAIVRAAVSTTGGT